MFNILPYHSSDLMSAFDLHTTLKNNRTHSQVCPINFAPLSAQNTDFLNTAVLTGQTVSVPVKTLAVEADGSVTDVTNYTSCRSTEEDVLKVSHYNHGLNQPGVKYLL